LFFRCDYEYIRLTILLLLESGNKTKGLYIMNEDKRLMKKPTIRYGALEENLNEYELLLVKNAGLEVGKEIPVDEFIDKIKEVDTDYLFCVEGYTDIDHYKSKMIDRTRHGDTVETIYFEK